MENLNSKEMLLLELDACTRLFRYNENLLKRYNGRSVGELTAHDFAIIKEATKRMKDLISMSGQLRMLANTKFGMVAF